MTTDEEQAMKAMFQDFISATVTYALGPPSTQASETFRKALQDAEAFMVRWKNDGLDMAGAAVGGRDARKSKQTCEGGVLFSEMGDECPDCGATIDDLCPFSKAAKVTPTTATVKSRDGGERG